MGSDTPIEWCDDTLNWWWGCVKVSPACSHCYAETLNNRFKQGEWGRGTKRGSVKGAPALLRKILRRAVREGRPRSVFVNSMSDTFEKHPQLVAYRRRAWSLMREAAQVRLADGRQAVHFLLLTKRPEVALAWKREYGWIDGAWLGVTVEDQRRADKRIPVALQLGVPVFLSCEPLLDCLTGEWVSACDGPAAEELAAAVQLPGRVQWVIAGGESGPRARPTHPDWLRALRDQCAAAEVPFFFKQWGRWGGVWGYESLDGRPYTAMGALGKKHTGRVLDGAVYDGKPVEVPDGA